MKFVASLPLFFLILSGQVTEEASAKTDINHPILEAKVVDAVLSSESPEDVTNDIKAVKEVTFYMWMLWKLSI